MYPCESCECVSPPGLGAYEWIDQIGNVAVRVIDATRGTPSTSLTVPMRPRTAMPPIYEDPEIVQTSAQPATDWMPWLVGGALLFALMRR